ncbi:MAG: cation:proton antiporter [Bryobacteraceae bacterium]
MLRRVGAYLLMLGGSIGLFFWVLTAGRQLPSASGSAAAVSKPVASRLEVLPHVLLALLLIIALARLMGWLFRRIHQPAVIGEVVAGIALGPSLLGQVWPEAAALLFPSEITPLLNVLAQVGVILFLFLVGLELNTDLLRQGSHSSVAISHASIAAPFLLGSTAALWMYTKYAGPGVSFAIFSLFLGIALSVTAFPVLARILTDSRMQRTRIGVLALTCAAVDDATAWCLLALLSSVAQAAPERAVLPFVLTILFIGTMVTLRPLVLRLVRFQESRGKLTQGGVAIVFMALLVCALTTEWIGIHALFGAFLLGAIIPHDSMVAAEIRGKLEDTVVVLLLPAFFAFTGLRTQIGLLQGFEHWMYCGVIILLASVGKFGGSYLAARFTGLDSNIAASIGVLMNTRGLMELIVLNLGLDLGILSPTLFAMCVIMALVTTVATAPILHYLRRKESRVLEGRSEAEPESAQRI